MGGRWLARFADNFSFIHGLFLKSSAAIHDTRTESGKHHCNLSNYKSVAHTAYHAIGKRVIRSLVLSQQTAQ